MLVAQLSTEQWLELSHETRQKLVRLFGIPRSGGTVIYANRVTSDGHTFTDLSVVSQDKMKAYLGKGFEDDNNFYDLFENVLKKLEGDSTTIVANEAKRIQDEHIARWLIILRGMKQQSVEFGLVESFNEILKEFLPSSNTHTFDVQLQEGATAPRRKKRAK